jgi:sugar (pentulose or hexulose) kinase
MLRCIRAGDEIMKAEKNNQCVLSIDAGTQSIRAVLVDIKGDLHDLVKIPIEPYFSDKPGWAEQDPDYLWKILCAACKKLMSITCVPKESIKGVTITTQRNTMINLDKNGKPLRPAIIWLDQRKAKIDGFPSGLIRFGLRAVNFLHTVEHVITECESNWIRQNQPDIWKNTHKYLFLSGFFNYRMTGEYFDSTGNIVGYVPFNYKTQTWASGSDLKWRMFPMDKSLLPGLVKPSEILGHVTKKASIETGIPAGLPVVASAADKACEVLGSGCGSPDVACLSYGTTATIETTNSKYVEITPFMPPYPSAIAGFYNTEVMVYRGFWMVSWFMKEFGISETQIAAKKGVNPEKLFDEEILKIPPGSMGLMLQPYWSPGVRIPGPEAKGAIIGFGDVHTRSHVYRAILEGLAYALKEGAIRTEKRNKVRINRLIVSGGGAQSRVAMQITADIFGIRAERPHTSETSALGAAIDAAVGLGLFPDFESAVKSMTRIGESYDPIPSNNAMYNELFERVYLKMYKRLQPLYSEIMDITGYPAKS